jgi:arylformamidase
MKRYIELSYPIHMGMPSLPFSHHPITETVQVGRIKLDGSMSHRVCFGTHTGTHIDSPSHMIENKKPYIDEIEPARLIGKAKLFTIPKDRGDKITDSDIINCAVPIDEADMIIFNTGWSKYWGEKSFYQNFPTFTLEAVEILVKKRISLIGMDTPSPDQFGLPDGAIEKNRNHKTFFNNDILILEALTNLDQISSINFELIALPLRASNMDGFPVRALAICETNHN